MLKFFKISFAVLTACLTIGSLSSFRNLDDTIWHYEDTGNGEFNDPANWKPGEAPVGSCGEDENIPCQTHEEMSEQDLQTLLQNNSGSALFTYVSKRAA